MKGKFCKSKFIKLLEETPNVAYAAKGAGVSRATIYRWMKSDKEFNWAVTAALEYGELFRIDAAEMALLSLVAKGDFKAIRYYLEHHSERYKTLASVKLRELDITEQEILQVHKDRKREAEVKQMSGAELHEMFKKNREEMDEMVNLYEKTGQARSTVKGKNNFPTGDLPLAPKTPFSSSSDDAANDTS